MQSVNPFYEKQPPLLFVDELKAPVHQNKPDWFVRSEKAEGEAEAMGMYLVNHFPDEEKLLETAVCDFERFLSVYEIGGEKFPIYLEYGKTSVFEEYTVSVSERRCTVTAQDTEGIRRGIIYIENALCRSEGAFLPLGEVVRTPKIKARITKGFFSPTNRPPKNIDELMDDVDYYPEEYMNRLAHDGTNGLYIYTRLSDLVRTDIIPEYGENSERRIAKLNKIIARCKRYGVGVYVFFIDPAFLTEELAQKHPDIKGVPTGNQYAFCTHSENGRRYCVEAMEKLARALPEAAGFINLSFGERTTTCASGDTSLCPRCKNYSKPQIVADASNLMREGIRRAGTKADYISWTYGYRFWTEEQTRQFVHFCDEDVYILNNFEEMGVNRQLGKDRLAVDYWLAYKGPSDRFRAGLETAAAENKKMYAKMQVCCSHEIATVPYIPVPGILFDKFNTDIYGVVESWYFGNYPSLMSKAAGELAFLHDFSEKDKFLENLAAIYCGKSGAKKAVEAFRHFEEAYLHYPTNIMFSYYGPMHDGVVWELQLIPKNRQLPRSWLFLDAPTGDRIHECMRSGHTIDETVILLSEMKKHWEKGLRALPSSAPDELQSVARALSVLIESGKNIMNFYKMRLELNNAEDKSAQLENMAALVEDEIENSKKMIGICRQDVRLGYHSEAEHFKYFPAQLEKRIGALQKLLETEFVTVRKRIEEGKEPISWDVCFSDKKYPLAKSCEESPKEKIGSEDACFGVWEDEESFHIALEGQRDFRCNIGFFNAPARPTERVFLQKGKASIGDIYSGIFGKEREKELSKYKITFTQTENLDRYLVTVKKTDVEANGINPVRFSVSANDKPWAEDKNYVNRLGCANSSLEYGTLERQPSSETEKTVNP